MKVTCYGAAREVTGSKHLIRCNNLNILLDCGMFQGHREESDKKNHKFPLDPDEIHAVILSHAHIDHSGLLPLLYKRGYNGPIYCTPATKDLCGYMLKDSAFIQERDAEWLAKKKKKFVPPLYDASDAENVLNQFSEIHLHKTSEILPGLHLTYYNAGHILGSAMVHLQWNEDGRERSLLFSGDIGRKHLPILKDPDEPPAADVVIMESTYGDRDHDDLLDIEDRIRDVVRDTVQRGGKIIIPSFALERAQEVVYTLKRLQSRDELPSIPIFVDSPLSVDVTQVFRRHVECFDDEIRELMLGDGEPFRPQGIKYIRDVQDSIALNDLKGPAIIISASGMCEHGRIQHHLKNNCTNPDNTIMIVGFQAEHTLGRRIVERREFIKIFGVEYPLKARVEVVNAFSCHAGRTDLLEFAQAVAPKAERILLVHGEEKAMDALKSGLAERGITQVEIPEFGETLEF